MPPICSLLGASSASAKRIRNSDRWLPEYTNDLLDLLYVLGRLIALEPRQANLLERICAGKLRKADELREAGAFVHAEGETTSQKGKKKSKS